MNIAGAVAEHAAYIGHTQEDAEEGTGEERAGLTHDVRFAVVALRPFAKFFPVLMILL